MSDILTFVYWYLWILRSRNATVIYFQFWLYESWISPLILKAFEKKFDSVWLHGLLLFGLQPITEAVVLLLQTGDNKRQSKRQKSYFLKGYDLTLHNFTDLFKSPRRDSICFCLLRQWVLNVPTSSCCSFSQSVNSECCWGGTCWPPLCSWSFSWSRRLSASLDFKKAWWTWEKLWGAVHHPSTHSIYLPIDPFIRLQRVFADIFPRLFCSRGSQSTHWRRAEGPGTIPQRTVFHLEKRRKSYHHVWLQNTIH